MGCNKSKHASVASGNIKNSDRSRTVMPEIRKSNGGVDNVVKKATIDDLGVEKEVRVGVYDAPPCTAEIEAETGGDEDVVTTNVFKKGDENGDGGEATKGAVVDVNAVAEYGGELGGHEVEEADAAEIDGLESAGEVAVEAVEANEVEDISSKEEGVLEVVMEKCDVVVEAEKMAAAAENGRAEEGEDDILTEEDAVAKVEVGIAEADMAESGGASGTAESANEDNGHGEAAVVVIVGANVVNTIYAPAVEVAIDALAVEVAKEINLVENVEYKSCAEEAEGVVEEADMADDSQSAAEEVETNDASVVEIGRSIDDGEEERVMVSEANLAETTEESIVVSAVVEEPKAAEEAAADAAKPEAEGGAVMEETVSFS